MIRSDTTQPDDAELEQLSAYLDQQLPPAEAAALEARLQREPELRAALNELQATVTILRDLGPVAPPRSFSLDPATVAPRRTAWFGGWWRAGSAVAALLVAFVSIALLNQPGSFATMQPGAAPAASQAAPEAALATAPTATGGFSAAEAPQIAEAPLPAATAAPAATAPIAAGNARTSDPIAPAAPLAVPETQADQQNAAATPTADALSNAAPGDTAPVIVTPAISSPDTVTLNPPAATTTAAPPVILPGIIVMLGILILALGMLVYLFRRR